jgi:lysophospholipase L1-like esterase
MRRDRFKALMVLAGVTCAVWLPASSHAKERQWVETFQSSPAAYGVGAPEKWVKDAKSRLTTVTGTLRFQFPISIGGSAIRIRFSNETGTIPLKIGAASIALSTGFDGVASEVIMPVTFGGHAGITLPAGAPALSDPVALPTKAGAQILISAYIPEGIDIDALGATGMWAAAGDQTLTKTMTDATLVIGRPVVSGVSVVPVCTPSVIVTLGDSITAGGRKTPEARHGWPEALSTRLNTDEAKAPVAVINAGIAGNRIMSDGYGQSALARLDRDVLRIGGVTDVIVFEGINDIGFQGRQQFGITQPDIQASDLIEAYRQIISRAHARGIRVTGATLLPFAGAFYYTPAKEDMRQVVNNWIRMSGEFDAVVDVDARLRDPENTLSLAAAFDSGDHLHPNISGEDALSGAVAAAELSASAARCRTHN